MRDNSNNWRKYADQYKSPVDTGRKPIPLVKHPTGLDFSKTIGGTTYTTKTHFTPNATECLLAKISHLLDCQEE